MAELVRKENKGLLMRAFRLTVDVGSYKAGEVILVDESAFPAIGEMAVLERGKKIVCEPFRGIAEGLIGPVAGVCRGGGFRPERAITAA